MAAPTYGSGFMAIAPPVTSQPANAAEAMPGLDPAFVTEWNATKYLIPAEWEGNTALIAAMATLAYRYKGGTGVFVPNVSSISPTTTVHNATFTLTINGTNFDADAAVVFNGADVSNVTHVSNLQLTCVISGALILTAGTYPVVVRNGGGQVSNSTNLTVT